MRKAQCILSLLATTSMFLACSNEVVQYKEPICPDGQTYNKDSQACELVPICPATCPEGQYCDVATGMCKQAEITDICSHVNCDTGKSCLEIGGFANCVDTACIDNGAVKDCGEGKICANGECIDDGCKNKLCTADQTCIAGICLETACIDKSCAEGESCKGGQCIENICLDMTCTDGTVCVGGKCVLEACIGVECKQGKICQTDGSCKFDSAPGLIVSVANDDKTTDEQGKTASVSVALNHEPASDVTVTVLLSDDTEAKAICDSDTCTLVFTPANWNQSQSVTLAGLPDGMVDGDQKYSISFSAASDDTEFNGLAASIDDLVNLDADKASILVSTPDGTITSEAGGAVTLEISLSAKPSADVTFTVSSSDTTEGTVDTETITITPDDWDKPHIITITGQDDSEQETSEQNAYQITFGLTQSDDPNFNGLTIPPVQLINTDDETAGITLSESKIEVDESDTKAVIGIVLNSKPASDVTITAVSSAPEEAALETETLVFTPETWNTPQSITVAGVQDYKIDGDKTFEISFSIKSDDEAYALEAVILPGTCHDTTHAGANAIAESTTVSENGTEAKISVALIAIPQKNVTIQATIEDTSELALASNDMASLTFTPETWNTPQVIVIKGIDDNIIDGNISSRVTFASQSEDANFNGLQITPITFVTEDNDTAGLVITGSPTSLKEDQAEKATFTVALKTQPKADVTLTLQSTDASELIIPNNAPLTFTSQNWNTPQTVQVESVDDNYADGNIDAHIILTAASEDTDYDAISAESPIYTVVDNETATLVTSPGSLSLSPETTSGTVNISLSSAPTAPVTVTFDSARPTVATVIESSLTFTKDNWDTPQPITVKIAGYEEAQSVVNIKVKSASESNIYNGLEKSVAVTVVAFDHQTFGYTGSPQSVVLVPGVYQFEAWGASGGGTMDEGAFYATTTGFGGYAAGKLTVTKPMTIFIYVGGQGADAIVSQDVAGGWNGGGTGSHDRRDNESGGGGGGATDFRLVGGDWNNFDSLKSRIMVAGAGGGQCANFYYKGSGQIHAGYGGGLSGYSYTSAYVAGSQTSGYAFGYGKNGDGKVSKDGGDYGIGGGGGGYYGGSTQLAGSSNIACSGAGGSGFISGHTGCYAIKESSAQDSIEHTNSPNHYSGLIFTDTVMISGNQSMPTHNGGTETGHKGNGVAKIARITE